MRNDLLIDGLDVYVAYGISVCYGGYNGLVTYPPLKSITSNNWAEDDGVDADLLAPRLDTKEFSIMFATSASAKSGEFLNMLSNGAYHEFSFTPLGITRKLRLTSQPSRQSIFNLELFVLQFADDFPLNDYQYEPPTPIPTVWQRGYLIDDVDISEYGIWALQGSHDEIFKSPGVKKNLLVNSSNNHGVVYDGSNVMFEPKDVTIKCLLKAPSMEVFWRNYNAFLFDLIKPDERQLYIESVDEYFSFYYKSAQVTDFDTLLGKGARCEFSLTLVFTSFRPGQVEYLLASEDDKVIITENSTENKVEFINLKEYENR